MPFQLSEPEPGHRHPLAFSVGGNSLTIESVILNRASGQIKTGEIQL